MHPALWGDFTGLQKNDVILSVNGIKAADAGTLLQQAPALAPFQTLSLRIMRQQRESVLAVKSWTERRGLSRTARARWPIGRRSTTSGEESRLTACLGRGPGNRE